MHSSTSTDRSRASHKSYSRDQDGAPRAPRFRRLDMNHISAIQSLYKRYPFLGNRMEIHMPFGRARSTFSSSAVWVWPKFDKRPAGYLIFLEGYPPCIWFPERQEGLTLRWLLPPTFCQEGPTVCLANILAGESLLQIEDILLYGGRDCWSTETFSQRWETLLECWASLPPDQPLLAFTPRLVTPISLSEWPTHYDAALYWTIQPDHARQPRWYWRDVVTAPSYTPPRFIEPKMKRSAEFPDQMTAFCVPYTKMSLPDTYHLLSQDGTVIGIASIPTLNMSIELRQRFADKATAPVGIPVEVRWNEAFHKYQIVRIMPDESPIATTSIFRYHSTATE